MWWKLTLFIILAAIGIWVKCKILDNLVAQHFDEKEEEENA